MNNAHIVENKKILKRYKMNCRNKGLTKESIKAIVGNDLRLFINFIGNKPLSKVSHLDVQDFLLLCSEERSNGDEAVARKFNSINMLFKTLIKQETLNIKNSLDKLEKPKVRKKYRGHLTMEEYERLLKYLDASNETNKLRNLALISFFYSSGCRLTEVYQQNIENLDFTGRRFKVVGKGAKERICIFSRDTSKRLKKYLDTRADDIPALFISRQKNRLSKKAIQDVIKNTGKRAGIKKNLHPHLLRHTRAQNLLAKGASLETIQRLLGHESIATTQIYARMNMDSVQNEIANIDGDIGL
ncbi:tyrosine-type recombinase/integrase [Dethiothermospora halolimnae]|uniref:tyrosine-type recombinase/integrase n=1 Tax=Dethiothermospora halolimnae TaxID=3114390 RepID=UPI003CCBF98A